MAVGFSVFVADDVIGAATALRRAAHEGYAVIFVIEATALKIKDEIDAYRSSPMPAVIVIPGKSGTTGYGMDNVKKSVERASARYSVQGQDITVLPLIRVLLRGKAPADEPSPFAFDRRYNNSRAAVIKRVGK